MKKLDSALGGLQPTLILLGAEPGVGKSALMASLVDLQAKNGHKPFVASL
jgi:predicted ATP-dependent serine protease